MYLEHFGLQEPPFSLAPDPRYLYLSVQHREALAHLLYGVQHEGGFVQITGEVGTGKTTVCRCFLEQLPPGTRAAVILNPSLTAEELFAAVCDEFEIPRPPGPANLKVSLDLTNRFLLDAHAAGERAVLIIDEAQNLDPAVLEQVRLLTNLETSRHKLLQIVLMGQPELRATLARPDLRQLAQRITARFHLRPLTREETAAYVRHRLGVAGCHAELFPPGVIRRLQRLSRGVPRLINILCDRALLGAYVQGVHRVDRATLEQAAREVAGGESPAGPSWRPLALAAGGCVLAAALWFALAGHEAADSLPPPAAAPAANAPVSAAPAATASPAVPATPATATAPAPAMRPAPAPAARADAPVVAPPARAVAPQAATASGTPASAGPAATASPAVSLSLQALMELPGARSEEAAWLRLYRLWGIRARAGEGGCTQAPVHGLDCLRGAGGAQQLRQLDRPAIVGVRDAGGASRWLVIERLREKEATLVAGGARITVDVAVLEGFEIREFVLLWRPPAQTAGALTAGDEGPGVAWLAQRLDAALGKTASGGPAQVFDEALAERVRAYQRSRGLAADGVAGPAVLLSLDTDPGPGTPRLAARGEGT
ncbi:MAG TPA: AAA family ATPase [Candidatus Methanoperedens sp.]|nr:AAA family ATPase [Candidatus Methanoperedens sp.]